MAARQTKQHNKEKAVHKVTAAERAAIQKYLARDAAKPSVRFKVSKNGSDPEIGIDHPNEVVGDVLVKGILASADRDFVNGIVSQLANASAHGQDIDERGLNFMLSVIKGIEARDQLACGPDGGRPHGEHDIRAPPRPCGQHSRSGQRGTGFQ
jgi:hypothetical protein